MHRPETKIEREVKINATNLVHENQWIWLNGEFCESSSCSYTDMGYPMDWY
jgi:hypothetical protein